MVTSAHEAVHRIFQGHPEIIPPALRILHLPHPRDPAVEVLTNDLTEVRPLERRVDTLLRVIPSADDDAVRESFLLAIESQQRRDPDKGSSWTYYVSHLWEKYRTPVLLLVVCTDKSTADWAVGPFCHGALDKTVVSLHPLVLGPGNVPKIVDPEEARRDLAMAAFSAMTHARDDDVEDTLEALARALGTADEGVGAYFSEMVECGLRKTPAEDTWRAMMEVRSYFPGRGTLIEKAYLNGEAEGEAKGMAKGVAEERAMSVVRVLEGRGLPVPPTVRERVMACVDLDVLERWFHRALTVAAADDLFTDEVRAGEAHSHGAARPTRRQNV